METESLSPQSVTPDVVEQMTTQSGFSELAPPLQLALMLGAMVFVSGALVSVTSFTRIVIVLSFVRRALSTQEIPPNQVIIGLSFFLTLFVMGPTFNSIHQSSIKPYMDDQITASQAWEGSVVEMRAFMLRQTRPEDLSLFLNISKVGRVETTADIPTRVLIPSFMISELKTAFIMGFCIYIPFLLIDMVVSTILMSLGMMMMPPVIISTPCKLMLFVLVDGWHLIAYSLSQSFV